MTVHWFCDLRKGTSLHESTSSHVF